MPEARLNRSDACPGTLLHQFAEARVFKGDEPDLGDQFVEFDLGRLAYAGDRGAERGGGCRVEQGAERVRDCDQRDRGQSGDDPVGRRPAGDQLVDDAGACDDSRDRRQAADQVQEDGEDHGARGHAPDDRENDPCRRGYRGQTGPQAGARDLAVDPGPGRHDGLVSTDESRDRFTCRFHTYSL
ncbi:hypothetical protein [Amycolatopsis plumensis]|uniref:hypothetical protein n=1 Tax=Amycolatopsis plumensis TaxID=236508 RepID=UPI00360D8ED7